MIGTCKMANFISFSFISSQVFDEISFILFSVVYTILEFLKVSWTSCIASSRHLCSSSKMSWTDCVVPVVRISVLRHSKAFSVKYLQSTLADWKGKYRVTCWKGWNKQVGGNQTMLVLTSNPPPSTKNRSDLKTFDKNLL